MNKEIIVISATWCPSCLILKKHLKKIKLEYPNVEMKLLDYDLDEDKIREYEVGSTLPVIICNEIKLVGEKSYEEIIKFLKDCEVI